MASEEKTVEFLCSNCGEVIYINRDEVPKNPSYGKCNYCVKCEGEIDGYYKEEWFDERGNVI